MSYKGRTIKVSSLHMTYLRAFTPQSYGIAIPHSIAKTMEIKGLVESVLPKFGTPLWSITEKGRAAITAADSESITSTQGE